VKPFADPVHDAARFGDGPDRVVAVHGFAGTPAETRAVGECLAGRGWHVTLPLLPGFGRDFAALHRTRAGTWRDAVTAHLREARRKADATGGRVLAIGFSMGAAVTLCSLVRDRASVDGLVLLAPFTRFSDPRSRLLPLARYVLPTVRPYGSVDLDDPDVRESIVRKFGPVDLDDAEVRRRLRRDVTLPMCALDELRRVGRNALRSAPRLRHVPTLVVQGERDPTATAGATRALVARLGTPARTVWLGDGDHLFVLRGRPGHEQALLAIARFAEELREGVTLPRPWLGRGVDARRHG
jgi:pimeloyl-ACP methyl ester carboxylesterase